MHTKAEINRLHYFNEKNNSSFQSLIDCNEAILNEIDICVLLENDPENSIGLLDCDEDGWTNIDEWTLITNPNDAWSNF